MTGRTLFDKVWEAHVVAPEDDARPAVLYVDLHLIHEVTSPQAFAVLRERGIGVRRPERTLATLDHATPTTPHATDGRWPDAAPDAARQIAQLEANCAAFGIELCRPGSGRRGIVHVVGPELGATWPGATIVCGDSHTSTHGAFGALAFGIGTTEVGHVLATQCLLQRRPRTMRVCFDGDPPAGVSAKDMALAVCRELGAGGGSGHVLEFQGSAVRALSMSGRMTLCNMAIEAGARAGMVAPDETTFAWLAGRERAPRGAAWERAVAAWRGLCSDADAAFDAEVHIDATRLAPFVTWGTSPDTALPLDGRVPEVTDASAAAALAYMGLQAGQPIAGQHVDVVFVGSCTNGRLEDLRAAADVLDGRRVAAHVRMLVVPGSERVAAEARALGLDRVFEAAGAEWREPGCSMCIAMNGDRAAAGQYVVSTSNRNFAGRQGAGARTFLAGPATAAACAVAGRIVAPRELLAAGADAQEVERA